MLEALCGSLVTTGFKTERKLLLSEDSFKRHAKDALRLFAQSIAMTSCETRKCALSNI